MTKRKKGAQPGNTNAVKYGFYTRRLRVLSLSTSSINRLVRTYSHMPEPTQAELLQQALAELEHEWPEFKAICDDFRGMAPRTFPHPLKNDPPTQFPFVFIRFFRFLYWFLYSFSQTSCTPCKIASSFSLHFALPV